ncbi:hypothetical protein GVX86_08380 [[Haemophilus] felis]|nr:hypothetical protein [[Haemophilus] felis]NBI43358.1 hypothetical protein [[Haemophilus] felis]
MKKATKKTTFDLLFDLFLIALLLAFLAGPYVYLYCYLGMPGELSIVFGLAIQFLLACLLYGFFGSSSYSCSNGCKK